MAASATFEDYLREVAEGLHGTYVGLSPEQQMPIFMAHALPFSEWMKLKHHKPTSGSSRLR